MRSWWFALRQALQWIYTMDDSWLDSEWEQWSPVTLWKWFADHAAQGPLRVQRAVQRYCMQQRLAWEVRQLHVAIKRSFEQHGATFVVAPQQQLLVTGMTQCPRCRKTFATARQLSTHMWTAHAQCSDERQFMCDATCLSCSTNFFTSARLQQHLRYSRRFPDGCYCRLIWMYQPMTAVSVHMPDCLKGHLRVPKQVVEGPSLNPLHFPLSEDAALDNVDRIWNELNLPQDLPTERKQLVFVLCDALCREVEDWTSCDVSALVDNVVDQVANIPNQGLSSEHTGWAMSRWFMTCVTASRMHYIPGAQFASLFHQLEEALLTTVPFQLLRWKQRVREAFIPVEQERAGTPNPVSRMREVISDWQTSIGQFLQTIVAPLADLPSMTSVPVVIGPNGKEI